MDNVYVVILASDSGERLWPLTRKKNPQQLLPFKQKKSLLHQTIERAHSLVPKERCIIVTADDQEETIEKAVGHMVDTILVESLSRNTAAAMILAALEIEKRNPEATVIFMPADHYISDTNNFTEFVLHALDYAKESKEITLLGLKPTYSATGYGYIEYDKDLSVPTKITMLYEKPDKETAEEYVKKGFLWNSGICISHIKLFIDECERYLSDTISLLRMGVEDYSFYEEMESTSIEKGLLEKSNKISVLPVDFVWCDVGNLETFLSLRESGLGFDRVVSIESKNNLVDVQEGIVALVGVENLCVIQHDQVLLVVHRDHSEKVKQVLDVLRKDHKEEYL